MKFLKDFGALVAIAIAALGAAVAYGSLSQDVKAHGTALQRLDPQVQQNTTDTAVLKQATEDIKESLARIEKALNSHSR